MNAEINVALIGPGLVGQRHLNLLHKIDGILVVGVVAPDDLGTTKYGGKFVRYNSLRDLLWSHNPEGVIIASPTQFHCEQASTLIQASIPVLIEKPVGQSADEVRHLIHLANSKKVPVCVGQHRIHGRLFSRLRNLVQSDEFGLCHHFIAKSIFKKPPEYWEQRTWRTLPENGGVIGINVIHEIDLSQRLFGPITEVFCDLIAHPDFPDLASRGQAVVRFKNGTQGCFIFSDGSASTSSWELTTGENPSFAKHEDQSCYEFYFADGHLKFPEFQFVRDRHLDWLSRYEEQRIDVEPDDPLANQLKHFAAVIRGDEKPKATLEDALQNRLVMDAMFQSAASREWIPVP